MPESAKTIDLDRRLSVLEERMNTITESYDRGWEILRSNMREDSARRDAEFAKLREDMARRDTEMARRDTEMARRDTVNTRWLIGVIIAASAIVIAVLLATS